MPAPALPDGYSLDDYDYMIRDRLRMGAYTGVLERLVGPDSVVVDIGAGTGILSLLAAKLGARRVIAIEPDGAIETARKLAADNDLGDRIEFIQDLSTNVELSERANVIVTDLRSILPFHHGNLTSVIDARERLLAPGGVLIPQTDTLWSVPVEQSELFEAAAGLPPERAWGFDLSASRPLGTSRWIQTRVDPVNYLSAPAALGEIDYTTATGADFEGSAVHAAARDGTLHGFNVWFSTDLYAGIGFSTGLGARTVYRSGFFPLAEPVPVEAGDSVELAWYASATAGRYIFRWNTRVLAHDGGVRAEHRQSDMLPGNFTFERLKRRSKEHVAALGEQGAVAAFVLAAMEPGSVSLGDIANEVAERFPGRYSRWEDAFAAVADLAERYADRTAPDA